MGHNGITKGQLVGLLVNAIVGSIGFVLNLSQMTSWIGIIKIKVGRTGTFTGKGNIDKGSTSLHTNGIDKIPQMLGNGGPTLGGFGLFEKTGQAGLELQYFFIGKRRKKPVWV